MKIHPKLLYLLAFVSFFIPLSSHAQNAKLEFSTLLGGSGGIGSDAGFRQKIAVDSQRCIYTMGITTSLDFPITPGAYNSVFSYTEKIFVTKLDPSGSSIIYSTFLVGHGKEMPTGFQVDDDGNAYVSGSTHSIGYPRTPGSYFSDVNFEHREELTRVFLTKLNSSGSKIIYSIVFGDKVEDFESNFLGIDGEDHAYLMGYAHGYGKIETTTGALQVQPPDSMDVFSRPFICKFSQDGSKLEYATYFGGPSLGPQIDDFTVDRNGNAYLVGGVRSDDFPITGNLFASQRPYSFLSKINPSGTELVYSVSLPIFAINLAVDDSENVYLKSMNAEKEFPVTPGAYDTVNVIGGPGLCKFSSQLNQLIFSTRTFKFGKILGKDSYGRVYIGGDTEGKVVLPTTPDAYEGSFIGGKSDIFFCVFDAAGSKLLYSTYLGGSGEDRCTDLKVTGSGDVYLTGFTTSRDFPTTEGALSRTLNGSSDAFICKFSFDSGLVRVDDTPHEFSFSPAYPNPFNPSTTISFTLSAPTRTELAVYSITGQRIRTLLSGQLSAGAHTVTWDGLDASGKPVSSGVYLSRLTAGKNTATGKMLLLR